MQHSSACQLTGTFEHAHVAILHVWQVYLINTRKLGLTLQHCHSITFSVCFLIWLPTLLAGHHQDQASQPNGD